MINLSQIGDTGIAYDGVALSDYFIVCGLDMPAFPNIDTSSLAVDGKPGEWFTNRKIGTREIVVRLAMMTDRADRVDIMEEWLSLTPKLLKDEPKMLELGNGYYVNAIITGTSAITETMNWSKADITFKCFDPYVYGDTHEVPIHAGENTIYVKGTCSIRPVYNILGTDETVTLENDDTGKRTVIHGMVPDAPLVIYMEDYRCTARGYYKAADPSVSDFWPLTPGVNHINLSSGSGTLTYKERYI